MSSHAADTIAGDALTHLPGASAGAMLRDARVAAGVHIESIAFSLKVPVGKIEALENDNLAALPDAVFARALTSSVCRMLKIDPAPVLALLPQTKTQWLPANDTGVNATFRDESERFSAGGTFSRISKPLGLAVAVLLVGAGVLAWVPSEWMKIDFFTRSQPVAEIVSPPLLAQSVEPHGESAKTAEVLETAALVQVTEPVQAAASDPVPSSPAASPALSAITPRLELSARGETWIQVKDALGAVVLERILRAGEAATVNQPGRLSVVVGRADVTEVRVTGNKLDIASSARENVARFEVKP